MIPPKVQVGMFGMLVFSIMLLSLIGMWDDIADKTEGKWGYIDLAGAWTVKPTFRNARRFHHGLAPVLVGQNWGFIDATGTFVIKPEFGLVGEFTAAGYAWAAINTKHTTHIESEGREIWEGRSVYRYGSDAVAGVIDRQGKWVIPPRYELICDFHGKVACYGYVDYDISTKTFTEHYGLMSIDGKVLLDAATSGFKWIGDFVGGRALACKDYDRQECGALDDSGHWQAGAEVADVANDQVPADVSVKSGTFKYANAATGIFATIKQSWLGLVPAYGTVDKAGQWILTPRFAQAGPDGYSEGYLPVQCDSRCGLDKTP